jgi:hypothetical protein
MKLGEYLVESDYQIGKTIIAQIKALDKWALGAWGAKNIVLRDDGVQFEVRGSRLRGKVLVTFDKGADLYNVETGTIRNMEWKSKEHLHGIFAEDLVKTIDGLVG